MTWFFLWLSLILASIVFFGYIAFVLWRKAAALFRQLSKTAKVVGTFEEKVAAYEAKLTPAPEPALLDSQRSKDQYQINKLKKRQRYHERRRRHERTQATWDRIYG